MEVGSSPCSSRPKRKKSSQETIVSILSKIIACGQTWLPEIEVDVLGGSERERVMEESMEVDKVEEGTLEQLWASVVILRHIRFVCVWGGGGGILPEIHNYSVILI